MEEKMKFETPDLTKQNIDKVAELFPNVITERKDKKGTLTRGINFELLKQELSEDIVDGSECYDFTWVGKKESIIEANRPIRKTLRPCKEESKNWETTENLYIEGDNLEVLKLLQESYLNKVKMIYIDPPYNTGNDFVYKDDFRMKKDEYDEESGVYDEAGNRLFKNTDRNGRFHSDWCSMMYSRLKLAKNLLSEDGVIFISIDENEIKNLREIGDELFGDGNYISSVIWERAFSPKNDAKYLSVSHDYIVLYAKNLNNFVIGKLPRTSVANARYKNIDNDPRGVWISDNLTVKTYSEKYDYPIETPSGRMVLPSHGTCWRVSQRKLEELKFDNRIWFGKDGNNVPRLKRFLSEVQSGMVATTIWKHTEVGHNQEGRQEVKKLFDGLGFFDGPKPVRLMNRILKIANLKKDDIILDFFSGSSTTAHSVLQLNSEDGSNRKFIMVQLPELCDAKSEAYKAGYKTIAEIGKERIRRAGDKIEATKGDELGLSDLDIGFRVFKVDSSNMKDVYYGASEYDQKILDQFESNIKEDRTDIDLLYGVMLDWGLPLSLKHSEIVIDNICIHIVDEDPDLGISLIACFEEDVSEAVIRQIAQKAPLRAVFRDSSFQSSSEKINVTEIFKLVSPNTTVKVI